MKIDQIDAAARAARDYNKAVVDRDSAFAAEWMKISLGTDRRVRGRHDWPNSSHEDKRLIC